jgi:hypothetical protein
MHEATTMGNIFGQGPLRPCAFIAEVLLFDKLVIPRPATDKEMSVEIRCESIIC